MWNPQYVDANFNQILASKLTFSPTKHDEDDKNMINYPW